MQAIVINNKTAALVHDRKAPTIRPGHLLVRTVAIALNPGDWRTILSPRPIANAILGCDFAGVVLEVNAELNAKGWNVGDHVCGCAPGGSSKDADLGTFAEIILARSDYCIRIPVGMSFEDAATAGLSSMTVGQGLFQKMGLRLPGDGAPREGQEWLLIYGGSTAAGTLAVQLAKL